MTPVPLGCNLNSFRTASVPKISLKPLIALSSPSAYLLSLRVKMLCLSLIIKLSAFTIFQLSHWTEFIAFERDFEINL